MCPELPYILSALFFVCITCVARESFVSSRPIRVLLGDSVLNNSRYVAKHETVAAHLPAATVMLAADDARMSDVYGQLARVPPNTHAYLSIGGNNIADGPASVRDLFADYHKLVAMLKSHPHILRLTVFDVYKPPTKRALAPHIDAWNRMVHAIPGLDVIPLSTMLTRDDDFVYEIEPSAVGSRKIANSVLTGNAARRALASKGMLALTGRLAR